MSPKYECSGTGPKGEVRGEGEGRGGDGKRGEGRGERTERRGDGGGGGGRGEEERRGEEREEKNNDLCKKVLDNVGERNEKEER